MRHGSLFSGIGGFDLAAEWMGWENLFHCEQDEFCRTILNYYWPEAATYADIQETDFTIWRNRIDILTGGFPCQPYSQAGKRKGTEDERHLWPEMLRAIREIAPSYIVGENVAGIVNWNGGLVFEEICSDLEAEEYEVQPVILPAAGVNAPHRRDRVWFIAHATSHRDNRAPCESGSTFGGQDGRKNEQPCNRREVQPIANSGLQRQKKRQKQSVGINELCKKRNAPNSEGTGREGKCFCKQKQIQSNGQGCGDIQAGFEKFPTQPPVCSRNDGISEQLDGITFPKWRKESIKGYGNAIVPQVAYEIFKAIQKHEDNK